MRLAPCPNCKTMNFMPVKINRFWLFRPLGGGGMGSVYMAYDFEEPEKLLAAKVLFRTDDNRDVAIKALVNESRIGELLGDHPGLVKCVASGCEDNEYYSVMEYVEGKRLDKLIRWKGKLSERHVLKIATQVLAANAHIYEKGYLYRDLKPENIIVTAKGQAVLLDYGLCMLREDAVKALDEFVTGSPYFMPPERLWGLSEAAYSEIYSLGMVMYHALTGSTYFDSEEVDALARRHISRVRLTTASKMREFRPELVEVLSKMVKQDHQERYQTFEELRVALLLLQHDLTKTRST
ncbi:MAG: serine/threonine protein kinase [Lentisphaeria bacterium]|nr:serine/threonine protein kinase [Lentisphaeria bacterium]